jgi:hypothetical protein
MSDNVSRGPASRHTTLTPRWVSSFDSVPPPAPRTDHYLSWLDKRIGTGDLNPGLPLWVCKTVGGALPFIGCYAIATDDAIQWPVIVRGRAFAMLYGGEAV